ncbi:hypothetical protein CHARACLAT_023013 [Characodon lateralis]|uniref:Uncharacterized protein n=1 Tax=Characodon lateralis TaxID=208331 RepID=A0ABU7F598_9TELE|nr:hypothetical protein [Characodon lateralis]
MVLVSIKTQSPCGDTYPVTMFLSLVLLLLVSGSHAAHFYGTMMTYYPQETSTNGQVIFRYKLNFYSCTGGSWYCTGNCGFETLNTNSIKVEEIPSSWCQTERITPRWLPNNSPFMLE